jgi:hypothetical protein
MALPPSRLAGRWSRRRVELAGDVLQPSRALMRCDYCGGDREMDKLRIGQREHPPL